MKLSHLSWHIGQSDSDGIVQFDIESGDYRIRVTSPDGYGFTLQNQGTDDTLDSDIDPATGISDPFTVTAGETVTHVDVGLVPLPAVSCTITVSTPPDLISAINTANGSPEAETVCLDAGTYTFTAADNTLYGDNALPVITDSMTLYGLGDGATLTRDSADLFRFFYVDAGTDVTLENLTLSNADIGTSVHGGAIYTKGNTTLRNVTLSGNNAKRGGAVRMNGAILTLEDTLFEGNTASTDGGAIYSSGSGSSVVITSSVFSNNIATANGGAVHLAQSGTSSTFTDTIFTGNQGNVGGGIYAVIPVMDVTNSTFSYNTSNKEGGGIYTAGGDVTVNNTTFTNNSANTNGGAIRTSAALTVDASTFDSNSATLRGGAVYNLNAITMTNNSITNNTAVPEGGGLWVNHSGQANQITGNCISGNTATSAGGVWSATSTLDVTGNWWGAADGPSGSGTGTGDAVSNRADYAGFLSACPLD